MAAELITKARSLMGNKTGKIIAGAILVAIIALVFLILNSFKVFGNAAGNGLVQRTARVARGDLTVTVTGSGPIASSNRDELFSSVESTVTKVYFKEGDRVKAGDLLFELDDSEARLNVDKAKNSLQQTQLTYGSNITAVNNLTVRAPFSGSVSDIQVKAGDVLGKGETMLTLTDSGKLKLLVPFNGGVISSIAQGQEAVVHLPDFMQSVTGTVTYISDKPYYTTSGGQLYNVEIAVDNPGSLQDGMMANAEIPTSLGNISSNGSGVLKVSDRTVMKTDTGGTVRRINVVENQYVGGGEILIELQEDSVVLTKETTDLKLIDLQNQADTAEKQLDYYKITAPIDGVIVKLNVNTGDSVTKGKSLAIVSDNDHMEFPIPVDELDIARIKTGQKVNITVDALPETKNNPLTGSVVQIAAEGTSNNGVTTYPVSIALDNPENIKVGMNANAEIIVENKENVLYVPIEAVSKLNGRSMVTVADSPANEAGGQRSQNPGGSTPGNGGGTQPGTGENAGGSPSGNTGNRSTNGNGNSGGNRTTQGSFGSQGANAGNQGSSNTNTTYRQVEVGINNTNYIEIVSGLNEGDMVVLPQLSQSSSQMGGFGSFGGGGGNRQIMQVGSAPVR